MKGGQEGFLEEDVPGGMAGVRKGAPSGYLHVRRPGERAVVVVRQASEQGRGRVQPVTFRGSLRLCRSRWMVEASVGREGAAVERVPWGRA